jgi:hypothetical protein
MNAKNLKKDIGEKGISEELHEFVKSIVDPLPSEKEK